MVWMMRRQSGYSGLSLNFNASPVYDLVVHLLNTNQYKKAIYSECFFATNSRRIADGMVIPL